MFLINIFIFFYISIVNSYKSFFQQSAFEESYQSNAQNKPDIYLIVLDGHGREDILKSIYDYDAEPFISELESKGFYVQDNAISNYSQSYLSITSLFKMDYLNVPAQIVNSKSGDKKEIVNSLLNNKTFKFLKDNNYKIVIYDTGWSGSLELKRLADIKKNYWGISEFEYSLLGSTVFTPILGFDYIYSAHSSRTINVFNDLQNVSKIKNPTFTYAHILSPHPPFVFDKNGNSIKGSPIFTFRDEEFKNSITEGNEKYKAGYKAQISYIDKITLKTVDEILVNSKEPPIIILMSDHGPALKYDASNVTPLGVKERFSVFRAVYLPNKDYENFESTFSQINLLRVIFNQYLGTTYPYLPDNVILNSTLEHPLMFKDITEVYNTPLP